jgi:hypothetical protein
VLTIVPIQIAALAQYTAQFALEYCIYYQAAINLQGLIYAYSEITIPELTVYMEYLIALIVTGPLSFASGFTLQI